MPPRNYLRTKGTDSVEGLIRNFETNTLPANPKVQLDFGILGDDDDRLFDALKWLWEQGRLSPARLHALKGDGPALSAAVDVEGNPFAPATYSTVWDDVRAWQPKHTVPEDERL